MCDMHGAQENTEVVKLIHSSLSTHARWMLMHHVNSYPKVLTPSYTGWDPPNAKE